MDAYTLVMSALFGAVPRPSVCAGVHGQLLSLAPLVNCVESSAPSFATGWPPALSQSRLFGVSVQKLPSISKPATGEPATGTPQAYGARGSATRRSTERCLRRGRGALEDRWHSATAKPWLGPAPS